MDLTDAQWAVLDPLFRPRRRSDGRGRPWRDTRAVVNGVLWILRTGAPLQPTSQSPVHREWFAETQPFELRKLPVVGTSCAKLSNGSDAL